MYATVYLLALLCFDDRGQVEVGKESPFAKPEATAVDPQSVVAACKKMTISEYYDFVRRLGKAKDFAALAAIYQADLPDPSNAAGVACGNLPHDKAAAFCSGFEVGSSNWRAAFYALASHPKKDVIGYVKRLMTSSSAFTHAECYRLCTKAGWDDLLVDANGDSRDETPTFLTGFIVHETVGWHARHYITTIEQKQKESKKAD